MGVFLFSNNAKLFKKELFSGFRLSLAGQRSERAPGCGNRYRRSDLSPNKEAKGRCFPLASLVFGPASSVATSKGGTRIVPSVWIESEPTVDGQHPSRTGSDAAVP